MIVAAGCATAVPVLCALPTYFAPALRMGTVPVASLVVPLLAEAQFWHERCLIHIFDLVGPAMEYLMSSEANGVVCQDTFAAIVKTPVADMGLVRMVEARVEAHETESIPVTATTPLVMVWLFVLALCVRTARTVIGKDAEKCADLAEAMVTRLAAQYALVLAPYASDEYANWSRMDSAIATAIVAIRDMPGAAAVQIPTTFSDLVGSAIGKRRPRAPTDGKTAFTWPFGEAVVLARSQDRLVLVGFVDVCGEIWDFCDDSARCEEYPGQWTLSVTLHDDEVVTVDASRAMTGATILHLYSRRSMCSYNVASIAWQDSGSNERSVQSRWVCRCGDGIRLERRHTRSRRVDRGLGDAVGVLVPDARRDTV